MKRYIFLTSVIFLYIFVAYKSRIFHTYHTTMNTKIIQSKTKLATLDSSYKIGSSKHIKIEKLYFPQRKTLSYYMYGDLGFSRDFLMFITSTFKAKIDTDVKFSIYSDDGFRLKIDDKTVCQYTKSRPLKKTTCKTHITKGKHTLFIKYFQGYGMLGLKGIYRIMGKNYYIGQNSKYLDFYAQD